MNFKLIAEENIANLGHNPYPGRGIILGLSPDGKSAIQVYWIMGRSSNSRNRIFIPEEDGSLRTAAFDPSKLEDPSLIIYHPLRQVGEKFIATNGDQTDTIFDFLKEGKTVEEALFTRKYEHDAPNFTPRISGITNISKDAENLYELSILKSSYNSEQDCLRQFFKYQRGIQGFGHCITTYLGDGNPLPSYSGEPKIFPLQNSIEENANTYWKLLNDENKVSLLVRHIELETGKVELKVINANT
jgi:IMP cyclohydrolase